MMTEQDTPCKGLLALLGGESLRPGARSLWQHLLATDRGVVAVIPAALAAQKVGVAERHAARWVETLAGWDIDAQPVPLVSRAAAADPHLAELLAGASSIILTGGEPRALAGTLRASPAWASIQKAHYAGVPLIACGGAAVAMCELAYAPVQPVPPPPDLPVYEPFNGLGLLRGLVVLPAFNWLPVGAADRIMALFGPPAWLAGLDGEAALVADSVGWRVMGTGRITAWQSGGKRYHIAAGETLPPSLIPLYPVR